jgi:diguanylate cyclase (GGDEF)-like protein
MSPEVQAFSISTEDSNAIARLVKAMFEKTDAAPREELIKNTTDTLADYFQANNQQRQAIGTWVCEWLHELIPLLKNQAFASDSNPSKITLLLLHLPFDEESELYKTVSASIPIEDVAPLTPQQYLSLIQLSAMYLALDSDFAQQPLAELKNCCQEHGQDSLYALLICMQQALTLQLKSKHLDEQFCWIALIIKALQVLDKPTVIYFILRWVISLNWVRPHSLRKELLVDLFEANQQQVGLNQALILFELFNFPDKTVASGEKLNYLTKLKNLPTELLTVDQLQSMYYFSGSIKSSIESSFMESVSDFQQSNYYTYKYWNWIRSINHYLLEKLPSDEYLKVMPRMEGKTIELVNLINIQSNAYVETLQSNFNKINELYLKVEEMSLRDTLTSLYNRRFLYNNINELLLLAVRQQSPLSFVMIDIDDFKPINDTYGHLAGDFILTQMSEMLRNFFRKSDFIVRYGGEEFLIVMFNSDHVQSEQALDTLRRTVMGYNFQYNNVTLHVTISIGIASCIFKSAVATVNLEKLISEADDALYVSKNSGKNKITSTVITY